MSAAAPERFSPSRREMLGAVARWTVPTVATMTLGVRVLEAKASCPPCQRKQGATCRACTINQMLNCNCEPCLGPPYCAAVGPVAPALPSSSVSPAPGTQPLRQPTPGTQSRTPGGLTPLQQLQLERARTARDPFNQPMYRDPFGVERRPGAMETPGLYERLRPDTAGRRP